MRLANTRVVTCPFLFVRPDGTQLSEIGKLLKSEQVRAVIDVVSAPAGHGNEP